MVFRDVWNYRRKKEQPNKLRKRPITSFRTDLEIQSYLNRLKNYNSRSSFINKAIYFYIMFINNPKKILIELKRRNPELYKYINRKRFIN